MKGLRLWLPAILWMIIIFFFSSREHVQVSEEQTVNFIFFKTLHVLEYAILFLLNVRGLSFIKNKGDKNKILLLAAVLTIIYALTDEIHQLFVPTREGRLRDVIIDGIGVIISWSFLITLLPKMPLKLRHWVKRWLGR